MNNLLIIFMTVTIVLVLGMFDSIFGQTKFAIIGDYGDDDSEELAVSLLVKSWNPDFIITTGDNSYDSTNIDENIGQYYSDYIFPYNGNYGSTATENMFWPSLGNHDYNDGGGINDYFNYFTLPNNERYYDLVIGNVHLFMVNSNPEEPDGNDSSSAQANWIETRMLDCVANHLHWRIVVFHHAPFSSGSHQSIEYMRWPFQSWGAHYVVSGHDHDYERVEINGFPYFVNGSGGRNLHPFSTIVSGSVIGDYADFGAQLVEIDQSGDTMTVKFCHTDGNLIDAQTLINNIIPVELSLFRGKIVYDKILLEWKTTTELNNLGFEIERKTSSSSWKNIGFVSSNGTTTESRNYSFVDNNLIAGSFSYRLKQIDNDGRYRYSSIVEVEL